jgi:hypothetical protein
MAEDKKYRECMSEIAAVLTKYDMAGAVTVVSKERAMFRYQFPTWSCIHLTERELRFRSKRTDYPSDEAQRKAVELSVHIIMQMRDIAAQTFAMCEDIEKKLKEKFDIEHVSFSDFDAELNN